MKKIFTVIKKIIKKYFLVALLVMVFVLSAITSSYGAFYDDTNNYEQDPTYLLMNYYDNMNTHFIKFLLKLENNSETSYIADVINRHDNFFIEQTGDVSYRFYYLWKDNPSTTAAGTYTIFNNQTVPCSFGPLNYALYYDIGYSNGYYLTRHNTSGSINVPTCYIGYINDNIYQWSRYRLGYKDLDSISAMLTTIISTQETGNDLLNSINNKIQSVDNSINNDDTSGISTNIIADNPLQQGESETFFNSVFSIIVDGLTYPYSRSVVIPFPFVNYNLSFNSMFLSDTLGNFTDGIVPILDLIHLFWYFAIGLYIYKDIQKYKDEFRSGEVLKKTDTNIKTEML